MCKYNEEKEKDKIKAKRVINEWLCVSMSKSKRRKKIE